MAHGWRTYRYVNFLVYMGDIMESKIFYGVTLAPLASPLHRCSQERYCLPGILGSLTTFVVVFPSLLSKSKKGCSTHRSFSIYKILCHVFSPR